MDAFIDAAHRHIHQSHAVDHRDPLHAVCINGVACSFCMQLVSFALEVPLREIQGSSRGVADVALARQIAMYLAHTKLSISQVEVGRHFKRDKSTVTHACQLVETKRDDPAFDELVAKLETMLDALQTVSGQVAQHAVQQEADGWHGRGKVQ